MHLNNADNDIDVAGACLIAEALKANATLTALCLSSWLVSDDAAYASSTLAKIADNMIGVDGGCAIGAALTSNTTATSLELSCRLWVFGHLASRFQLKLYLNEIYVSSQLVRLFCSFALLTSVTTAKKKCLMQTVASDLVEPAHLLQVSHVDLRI